jgi:hypothetical protein
MGGASGSCCLSLVLRGQCLRHRKTRCLIWPIMKGPRWCGCCCLCPFQVSGSSMVWVQGSACCVDAVACALFRVQGLAWCGSKVQQSVWELLPVSFSGFRGQHGGWRQGPDKVQNGVWKLVPVLFSGCRGKHGVRVSFSMVCGCSCLCPCGWSALAIVGKGPLGVVL